jgi:hypothetical protein
VAYGISGFSVGGSDSGGGGVGVIDCSGVGVEGCSEDSFSGAESCIRVP